MTAANILLLMSDQHRADCVGFCNHPVVRTPNLDRLAREGVAFRHAYSSSALCAPARRTLLSGQSPRRHGVIDPAWKVPLRGSTMPQLLAANGYQTHLAGKLHVWPDWKSLGFQSADCADWITPQADNDYTRYMRRMVGRKPWVRGWHDYNQNSRTVCEWSLDPDTHFTHWCEQSAIRFLESRTHSSPFFLMVSFIPPHPPIFPLPDLLRRYLAMDPVPPVVSKWAQRFADLATTPQARFWCGGISPEEMHLFRSGYYASIEHVDQSIGAILRHVPENTVVLYLSDHGDMLGDQFLYHKRSPYEPAVRIPMIFWTAPGKPDSFVPGTSSAVVELMDVMPTILDIAGVRPPGPVDGQSLKGILHGDEPGERCIFGENALLPPLKSSMQFVTDGSWKYVSYPEANWQQFFHLDSDPNELNDLIADPRFVEERNNFGRILSDARKRPPLQ